MHISEGVLKPEILIAGAIVSLVVSIYALKKLKNEEIPLVAVFSALFFLASFIHVPIGPTSVHLILNGIIGAILGTRAFIAILIALLLQGLLFGYGGVSTLGINTLNLALPSLLGFAIISLHVDNAILKKIQYFLIGFLPISLSALFLSTTLALNGESFMVAAEIAFMAHVPIMFLEGFITMFALLFLEKVYPKILKQIK
ncbi:cobalt transporter CbiM [Sulfurospirillum arcachonense]|uniref:cobalt transporter CbiM n=1 Tax=Sulfurospirillum arcachonense TaxID=57666 RepID=UPI00046B070E|nr:cobalt transporter CbiM [Sulfurospirillum arcachonense]